MFLTDVSMIPIIAILLIFIARVWFKSEYYNFVGGQPAHYVGYYRSHRPTIG
ncbi:MAG: hypothetical protein HOC91_09185 [Nitrospinaceae bacterium]|jgi:hypothetical protein|nr:hypothetical protein [Nitrospinaceae bacterium]MBT3435763.1 hypothetical protein [Nitrospinaceae bacterium]MBT3819794.1 hypothetical protein [Nitrospinaceae bacterium]MBT4093202.1 hypothetical protein [Nitrospinaceae bacterium]MBT4430673.1 hypothetical protein [Nitrospinaceae bacterium]